MKVYVVGAIAERQSKREVLDASNQSTYQNYYDDDDAYEATLAEFSGACQALGAALVRAGHTVMLDIPSWDRLQSQTIVAPHVIQGIKRAESRSKPYEIILYQPKATEPRAPDTPTVADTIAELKAPNPDKASNIAWTNKVFITDEEFFTNMRAADAFILIGGGPGTGLTGQSAAYRTKPIVALTAFGGAAEQSFNLVLSPFYSERKISSVDNDLVSLTARWDKEPEKNRADAEAVVRFTETLQNNLERLAPGELPQRAFIGLLFIMLAAWAVTFWALPSRLPAIVIYMALLVLTSSLGTGLRILAAVQAKRAPALTATYIVTQLAMSTIAAFGFLLIYLVGGISFTGTMVALVEASNATIGTSVSVVGFAAGLLLPIGLLRAQMGSALSGNSADAKNGN